MDVNQQADLALGTKRPTKVVLVHFAIRQQQVCEHGIVDMDLPRIDPNNRTWQNQSAYDYRVRGYWPRGNRSVIPYFSCISSILSKYFPAFRQSQ